MSNPTAAVPAQTLDFVSLDKYWPIPSTADNYYPMEMLGMDPSTGYAAHFDDTAARVWLGLYDSLHKKIQDDTPSADLYLTVQRPRFYSMQLASGTVARPTDIGKAVFASDSGHVQTASTTFNNLAGMIVDIAQADWTLLTGASNVWVAPPVPGCLLGLVAQGFPAPGANTTAQAMSVTGGAGVGTGSGGPINLTAGASGAGATGNGGAISLTAGAAASTNGTGGAVTLTGGVGTGTGNGGAINLVPGAGGASGITGEVQINGSSDGAEVPSWLQAQGAAPSAGSFVVFIAPRAVRIKSFKAVFATASTSGTVTATKDTGTTAPGGGTAILTGTVSLAGTANTVVSGTLVATAATLQLAAGDRLSLTLAGTLTNLAGACIQIGVTPV